MANKYRCEVTVIAKCTYTVEIEADDESSAEDKATLRWRDETPDDFQVDKGYVSDWEVEAERLIAECPKCSEEHAVCTKGMRICNCAQFGTTTLWGKGRGIPHLIVNNICTPAPWWYQDEDYCAQCGASIEAKDAADAR